MLKTPIFSLSRWRSIAVWLSLSLSLGTVSPAQSADSGAEQYTPDTLGSAPTSAGQPECAPAEVLRTSDTPTTSPVQSFKKTIKAGNHKRKLKMPGGKRSYVVHVPKSYANSKKAVPVVLVLHGGLGNAWSAEWDSKMSERSEKDNFLAVYPQGTGRTNDHFLTWNAGGCCGIAMRHEVDDITFLRALIFKLTNDFNVDRSRIYIAGISNGGMMAYRAALEPPEMIAAIAPVEACMMSEPKLTSDSPVSVIAFHGTADKTVPYEGGDGGIPGYKLVATKVEDNIQYWGETQRVHKRACPRNQQVSLERNI